MFIWEKIRNPILEHDFWSLKDPCVAYHEGVFHLFCSVFSPGNRLQTLHVTTKDFVSFSHPIFLWGEGDNGRGSPDLTSIDNMWYLTYQSFDPRPGHDRTNTKCYYAQSPDLINWDIKDIEIARNLNVGQRAIDPTIAKWNNRYFCSFKQWQTPMLATSERLDNPDGWELLGKLDAPQSTENGQFIRIDGIWRLIMESKDGIREYQLEGNEDVTTGWASWKHAQMIRFPTQKGFNEIQNGGAGYIADWREHDGHFYAFYHVKYDPDARMNMGHYLGIARSVDLVNWELPPEEKQ
jgi:hypothetical protein